MIYFDNAATTRIKPQEVYDAYLDYAQSVGASPGRGSYKLAIQASRMLYQCRKTIASFFGVDDERNVVFTKNSTEAINLFANGYLRSGDHVLLSPYEHNAVLRPVHNLKLQGTLDYTVIPDAVFRDPENLLPPLIKPNTKLAFVTLASNLTGQLVFSPSVNSVLQQANVRIFVDASQGGGKGLVNMQRDNIDFLAFTGHKDLLGLPGVGGLCTKGPLCIQPLIQGGTGIFGDLYTNPEVFPDAYEAGTLNMPAIWALKAAIEYLRENHAAIQTYENQLLEQLLFGMRNIPGVIVYNLDCARVPTVCFNIDNRLSSDIVSELDQRGFCVRGGIHCAILAHETLGTVKTGAVRVSINHQNTKEEIEAFINAVEEIAQCT